MCGIIALIGTSSVVGSLVEALQRLEYRGYDSAGVATLSQERIMRVRRAGKVSALASEFRKHDLGSTIGVGHTRWATHGVPSEANAHPLMGKGRVAVVHNGIIALVAPVRVGKGATVGAGSVIVRDVPENGLGISRARQVNKRCVE